jgi:hypothetical protein
MNLMIRSILSLIILALTSVVQGNISIYQLNRLIQADALPDTSDNLQIKINKFYLEIMPPSSGVQFYRDGIIFLAKNKKMKKMMPGHISFGATEAYFAVPGDSVLGRKTLFSSASSFSYPCDALTFSNDLKTMYFTRSSKVNGSEKIYEAINQSENDTLPVWTEKHEPLEFCNDKYSYLHPTLSADGEFMIFSSDRPGSEGGMDLFMSLKEGDTWKAPQNLGNEINTTGNEVSPFLDSDNNLFFSSDGLKGYGGYDIFLCRFNHKIWDKPVNMTQLINSGNDELGFTLSKTDGSTGFFTSRQSTGKKVMQLYKVTLKRSFEVKNLKNLSDFLFDAISPEKNIPVTVSDTQTIAIKSKESKAVTQTVENVITEVKKQVVIYRIQFQSNSTSKGSYKIAINNTIYDTFEYFYKGEYRSTVGEFTVYTEALAFQTILRQSGYPDAFVVVFKNNVRSLEPELFR